MKFSGGTKYEASSAVGTATPFRRTAPSFCKCKALMKCTPPVRKTVKRKSAVRLDRVIPNPLGMVKIPKNLRGKKIATRRAASESENRMSGESHTHKNPHLTYNPLFL